MTTEERALWTWRSLSEEQSLTEVMKEHLARIRTLVVVWNDAETGAAGLAISDFTEIEFLRDDPDEQAFLNALEVFMAAATLERFEGVIRNPYANAEADDHFGLEGTPSREVAEQFLSGRDIELSAEPDEILLWENASRRSTGIDPKRPFGSESVSRDVRALIDPEKTLSNAAFAKRRKWLESRLLLLLQFFVQNAEMEPGLWKRGEDWVWRVVSPDEPTPQGEPLLRADWADRIFQQNHYENKDYTETLHALIHLVWNDRLSGSYPDLLRQFRLETHFDSAANAEYEGTVEERFRAALAAFPERKGDASVWFTLSFVRILNAQARFEEARAVLQAAELFEIDPEEVDLSSVNPVGIAWVEGLIVRHGTGAMPEEEYRAALFGTHSGWKVQPSLWTFVWDLHHEPEAYEDGAQEPGLVHARALAAQLELSRGGYVPDEQPKHF